MVEVMCETVESNDVADHDKAKYNSNNHWEGELPADYFEILASGQTRNWIDAFRGSYDVIDFDAADIAWMKRAHEMGKSTGRFSKCFDDELDDTVKKYQAQSARIFKRDESNKPIGYFVRTDTVSLKRGQHGIGPYYNLRDVIASSCSCIHGHTPIEATTESLRYYILPWVPINMDQEFRVFVYKRQITAISSQAVYNINKTLNCLSVEQRLATIKLWVRTLVEYIYGVMDRISTDSYSIDIALIPRRGSTEPAPTNPSDYSFTFSEGACDAELSTTDAEPLEAYLIEFNCFGKEYAAGSALFHWLLDEEKLYDLRGERKIYFRYVIR